MLGSMTKVGFTSRDIAREAGVSQSTVSRALRRDPKVAAETQRLVHEVARRHGYVTNHAARSLKTRRTQTIGVVVANLRNPYFLEVVDGLRDELHVAGYRTFLVSDQRSRPDQQGQGDGEDLVDLLRGSVDGVVIATALGADSAATGLADLGMPVVLINREVEGRPLDRVLSDYAAGGALAAEHLVDLGHRRIGLITGPSAMAVFRDREEAFRRTLDALGAPFDERLRREGPFSYETGEQLGAELMELPDPPTAIFCADDLVAFGVLDAAQRHGLRVPEDLSVIGYDDLAMAGWDRFGLTTVRQPMDEMARAAARAVVARIQGDDETAEPQRQVHPVCLVRRSSTGPARD